MGYLLGVNKRCLFETESDLKYAQPKGVYQDGTQYEINEMVIDQGWTAVALTQTTDRPSPQPQGPEFFIYDGTAPTTSDTSKLILTGNRYLFSQAAFLSAYRANVVAGNIYDVYLVIDPLGTPVVQNISTLEPTSTGWIEINIERQIVL